MDITVYTTTIELFRTSNVNREKQFVKKVYNKETEKEKLLNAKTESDLLQKLLAFESLYLDTTKRFQTTSDFISYYCNTSLADTKAKLIQNKYICENVFLNPTLKINGVSFTDLLLQDVTDEVLSAYFEIIYTLYGEKNFKRVSSYLIYILTIWRFLYGNYPHFFHPITTFYIKEPIGTYIPNEFELERIRYCLEIDDKIPLRYRVAFMISLETGLQIPEILTIDYRSIENDTLAYNGTTYQVSSFVTKALFELKENPFVVDGRQVTHATFNTEFNVFKKRYMFPTALSLRSFQYLGMEKSDLGRSLKKSLELSISYRNMEVSFEEQTQRNYDHILEYYSRLKGR